MRNELFKFYYETKRIYKNSFTSSKLMNGPDSSRNKLNVHSIIYLLTKNGISHSLYTKTCDGCEEQKGKHARCSTPRSAQRKFENSTYKIHPRSST